jgi:hypothetical protein
VTKIMDRDIVWALTGAYRGGTDFSFLSECTQILEAIERLKLPNAYEFSRAFTQRANELLIAARADGRIKNFEWHGHLPEQERDAASIRSGSSFEKVASTKCQKCPAFVFTFP